jgi:hypothetical protein
VVTVTTDAGRLDVRLTGWDRVWALKRAIVVPLEHVESIEHDPDTARSNQWRGIRFPGTYVPGVITAGTYWWKGRWTFWSVRNPDKAVIISLRNERYDKLILQVDHPESLITDLRRELASPPANR